MAIDNFNDTTPAAPAGGTNVRWQTDSSSPKNVSAYVVMPSVASTTNLLSGDGSGNAIDSGVATSALVKKYSTTFTSATSVTVTHSLGSTAVVVMCWDGSGNKIEPEGVVVTSSTVVTLTFGVAQSGSVVVIG